MKNAIFKIFAYCIYLKIFKTLKFKQCFIIKLLILILLVFGFTNCTQKKLFLNLQKNRIDDFDLFYNDKPKVITFEIEGSSNEKFIFEFDINGNLLKKNQLLDANISMKSDYTFNNNICTKYFKVQNDKEIIHNDKTFKINDSTFCKNSYYNNSHSLLSYEILNYNSLGFLISQVKYSPFRKINNICDSVVYTNNNYGQPIKVENYSKCIFPNYKLVTYNHYSKGNLDSSITFWNDTLHAKQIYEYDRNNHYLKKESFNRMNSKKFITTYFITQIDNKLNWTERTIKNSNGSTKKEIQKITYWE